MSSQPPVGTDLTALSPLASEVAVTMARIASDIALVIDRDGVIRSVAEGAALPGNCSDWVGQRWVDTASHDTRRKIELLLEELNASGVSKRREVNHPGVDGTEEVPLAWTAIRLGNDGPVVAVGRDLRTVAAIQRRFLDAQQEMEQDYWQRRNADNRYRLLFQVAQDAVIVLDAQTFEIIDTNERGQALLRHPGRALLGHTIAKALPQHAQAAVAELLGQARTTGRAGEIQVRLWPGEPSVELLATPIRVDRRYLLLLRARVADSREDERSSPHLMRSMVESMADAIVITDSAGRICHSNTAFEVLTGRVGDGQLRGQALMSVVDDGDGQWQHLIQRTRLQGLSAGAALTVRCHGVPMPVQVSATLLTEGEQEHLGFTISPLASGTARPASMAEDALPGWRGIRAQLGVTPLDQLVQEAALSAECELIEQALKAGSGRIAPASRLLMVSTDELAQRIQALGLRALGVDDAAWPPTLN